MTKTYEGSCLCGAVKLEVSGAPLMQGFCHCGTCRGWSATPVTAYALWPTAAVRIVAGEKKLKAYDRPGKLSRHHCADCGGAVATGLGGSPLTDVYPPILAGFAFAPAAHVNYAERMIDMKDGLPKFRDMPKEAGGSGEMIGE